MADKKKRKSKMKVIVSKQNRNKQQNQQVTVNVAIGRRSSNKQQQALPQQPKASNLNYEVFRTINSYVTQQQKKADETPKDTSPALFQNTPQAQPTTRLPQPNTPPPSNIARVLQNNKIHNSTSVPQETTTKRPIAHDFEKILNSKKAFEEENEKQTNKKDDVAETQSSIPTAIRMTTKGLPFRKTRDEKVAYNDYMENVVGNKPANERTKEEYKAYNEYLNSIGKPRADEGQQSIEPFLRPISRKPKKIQPVDFDTVDEEEMNRVRKEDDEDDEIFFSPLKRKPT